MTPATNRAPLRVAHTGDLHLTSGPRFADTSRVLDWMVSDGIEQGVDLWLVGGDLSGTHEVPHVATTEERNFLAAMFQRMATAAPVFILYGNHDVDRDISIYERLEGENPIVVFTEPREYQIDGKVRICALPYPFKRGLLLGPLESIRESNETASEAVRGLVRGWAGRFRDAKPALPTILYGHCNITGARTSGDEILSGQEVELSADEVGDDAWDYVALSHIHLHQQMGPRAWYAGSPSSQTFGEEDEKGYVIADVFVDETPVIHRRVAPARRMATVDATWVQVDGEWRWAGANETGHVPEGAEVRLRVAIPEDAAATCPVAALVAELEARGFTVTPERKIIPRQRQRSEKIQRAATNAEKIAAWWGTLGETAPKESQQARILEKLAALEAELAGDATSHEEAPVRAGEEQAA